MKSETVSRYSWLQVRANETFKKRIKRAIENQGGGTISQYVRVAIIEKFERDGVE